MNGSINLYVHVHSVSAFLHGMCYRLMQRGWITQAAPDAIPSLGRMHPLSIIIQRADGWNKADAVANVPECTFY
jgi:hypothetical protein